MHNRDKEIIVGVLDEISMHLIVHSASLVLPSRPLHIRAHGVEQQSGAVKQLL